MVSLYCMEKRGNHPPFFCQSITNRSRHSNPWWDHFLAAIGYYQFPILPPVPGVQPMSLSLATLLVSLSLFGQSEVAQSVGLAKIDITPAFPVRLSGFGFRRSESEGVNQRIWAKAMAIGDKDPAIIITVDNLGVSASLHSFLQKRLDLSPGRLVIAASHTHTAPMLSGVCPTLFGEPIPADHQVHIQQYTDLFLVQLEKLARAALSDRKKAILQWGIGTSFLAKNRRNPDGPVDHDLPVMAIKSPDGKIRGVWANYACHAVTLSHNKIGGDWPGFAQQAIEDSHPGIIALFSIGCGADSNPVSGVVGDKVDLASRQGLAMAQSVEAVLQAPMKPINGSLSTNQKTIDLALGDHPSRARWIELAKKTDAIGHHARVNISRLDKGEPLPRSVPYGITTWTFGDSLSMVFLPGEVVVDYSHRLKRELDKSKLWVTAYANDSPCYIPSERILREGGYEGGGAMVYYDLPVPFRAGLEDKILAEVRAQLPKLIVSEPPVSGAISPLESLAKIQVRPGMKAEIVAAEPMVQSPVAIDFGHDGSLWVAEMFDYPMGPKGNYEPAGRVRLLDQMNERGIPKRSRVFLDGIPFPTGITVWRKGVLICAAPDILYAEDTDGDGKADIVEKRFSNFNTGNFHARVNSLVPGLDGWIHGSCGLLGGQILSHKTGKILALGGRDFRIKPDTGEMEPATGQTQQGRIRNDFGQWFGCDNTTLATHLVVADEALRRNPFAVYPSVVARIATSPSVTRLHPVGPVQMFQLSGAPNSATAATGIGVYRDNLLGQSLRGDLFTCESVNLLVHRMKLVPKGSTFEAIIPPGEEKAEFIASGDPWFRPVQMRTGPDGAIWIVDMHRAVIEHPRWIPQVELDRVDTRAGAEMGRILRIVPTDKPLRTIPKLPQLDPGDLAQAMDTPNGTLRDMVMQEILFRPVRVRALVASHLKTLDFKDPAVRIQALATLEVLDSNAVTSRLSKSLQDHDPGVQAMALRLAGPRMNDPKTLSLVVDLSTNPDPRVRLEAAIALGNSDTPQAVEALRKLWNLAEGDPYLVAAIQSSIRPTTVGALIRSFIQSSNPPGGSLSSLFAMASAQKNFSVLEESLLLYLEEDPAKGKMASVGLLLGFGVAPQQKAGVERLEIWKQLARAIVADPLKPLDQRVAAIGLLGYSGKDDPLLAGLLNPQHPPQIQIAAMDRLEKMPTATVTLMKALVGLSPSFRNAALERILGRQGGDLALVKALEQKVISQSILDAGMRQRLLMTRDDGLRKRAQAVLETSLEGGRGLVIAQYPKISTKGDPIKGREHFKKECAGCHRLDGMGFEVGPDLAMVTGKGYDWLIQEILDPSRNMDGRYAQIVIATKKGQILSGLVASENASSISLKMQEGRMQSILRSEIEEMATYGKSLMPEGLEKHLNPAAMMDLIAYLQTQITPPKVFVGNSPQAVSIGPKHTNLKAKNAAIYGGDIAFETEFENIGMWHGLQDHISWTVLGSKPTQWDVWLDFSCDDASAGNTLIMETASGSLRIKVEPTGSWARYRLMFGGTITLGAGEDRIVVRPAGPLRSALIDLKGIHLVVPGGVPVGSTIEGTNADPGHTAGIARILLDPKESEERKQRLIERNLPMAAALISALTEDRSMNEEEEYRRIPTIWRIAIHAAKSTNKAVIAEILAVSLPKNNQPLRDWQAVVVGGGIINGLTLANQWPIPWLEALLVPNPDLQRRYQRALELAATMTDNVRIKTGTRYDALRMIAMDGFNKRGAQLQKYLAPGTDDELVMGAISGLSDIPGEMVAGIMVNVLPRLNQENRNLAIGGLVRNVQRALVLLDALETGKAKVDWVKGPHAKILRELGDPSLRERTEKLLGK